MSQSSLLALRPEYNEILHENNEALYEKEFEPKKEFKWIACKFYREGEPASCRIGSECKFAHGAHELIERPRTTPVEPRGVKRSAEAAKLLCIHHLRGQCDKGDECAFIHDKEEFKKSPPANYKTTLCGNYMGTGVCRRAEACGFAHGRYELRPHAFKGDFEEKIKESPNWKTILCQFYMKNSECRNKEDCPYAHGANELRMSKQSPHENAPNVIKAGINPGAPRPPCKFFATGNCKSGAKCAFSHGQEHEVAQMPGGVRMGGYEIVDYTTDYAPPVANVMPVLEPEPIVDTPELPGIGLSKDQIYSEFVDFLSQKYQGAAGQRMQPVIMEQPHLIQEAQSIQMSALARSPRPVVPMVRMSAGPGSQPRATAAQPILRNPMHQAVPGIPLNRAVPGVPMSRSLGGVNVKRDVRIPGSRDNAGLPRSREIGEVHGSREIGGIHGSREIGGIHGSREIAGIHGSRDVAGLSGSRGAPARELVKNAVRESLVAQPSAHMGRQPGTIISRHVGSAGAVSSNGRMSKAPTERGKHEFGAFEDLY